MARGRSNQFKIVRQAEFSGNGFTKLKLGLKELLDSGLVEMVFPSQCPCCGKPLQVFVGLTGDRTYEINSDGSYGKVVEEDIDPFYESPTFTCSNLDCEFEFAIEELGDANDRKTKTYESRND